MPWYDGLEAEDIGRIQGKGWDKLEGDALAKAQYSSYRGLEQLSGTLRGTPIDRLLVLPEGEDEAAWKPVFGKLGVPDAPDKYAKPEGVELADPDLAWLRQAAHVANVPVKAFPKFVAEYTKRAGEEKIAATTAATEAAQKAATEKAEAAARVRGANEAVMKQQWGAEYDKTLASAKQMAGRLGYTAEDIAAVIDSDKGAPHLKQWADMAKAAGEAPLHGAGGNGGGLGGGTRSVEEIQAEKSKIMADVSGKMLTPDEAKKVFPRIMELDRELVAASHARRI